MRIGYVPNVYDSSIGIGSFAVSVSLLSLGRTSPRPAPWRISAGCLLAVVLFYF